MTPFVEELPRHYQQSPQDTELQRVLEQAAVRVEADLDFTLEQLFPSTASGWGLKLWEDALGLRRETGQTEQQRRGRVLAKLKGAGVSTRERICAAAEGFFAGTAQIEEFPGEYRFVLHLTAQPGALSALEPLCAAVQELKPAHLAFSLCMEALPVAHTLRMGGMAGTGLRLGGQNAKDRLTFRQTLSVGGAASAQTVFPVPEDSALPPAVTILRTGGVCTIIANASKGE